MLLAPSEAGSVETQWYFPSLTGGRLALLSVAAPACRGVDLGGNCRASQEMVRRYLQPSYGAEARDFTLDQTQAQVPS